MAVVVAVAVAGTTAIVCVDVAGTTAIVVGRGVRPRCNIAGVSNPFGGGCCRSEQARRLIVEATRRDDSILTRIPSLSDTVVVEGCGSSTSVLSFRAVGERGEEDPSHASCVSGSTVPQTHSLLGN